MNATNGRDYALEGVLDAWRRVDGWVARLEAFLVIVATLVMVGAIFGQAVRRLVTATNLFGATELATHLLVWVGFLAASLATRERKHIVVDALPRLLGERPLVRWLAIGTSLVTAAFLLYMVHASWSYLHSFGVQGRVSTALNIPRSWVVVALPVTMALMAVRFLQAAVEEAAIELGLYPAEKRFVPAGLGELLAEEDGGAPAPQAEQGEGA